MYYYYYYYYYAIAVKIYSILVTTTAFCGITFHATQETLPIY